MGGVTPFAAKFYVFEEIRFLALRDYMKISNNGE